jgi:hypothetical protein
LAGVRQNLEFVPLFFLTYLYVRTKRALRTFVILFAVIAAANGVVTAWQYRLSPGQLAAWGPGYAERVLAEGQFGLAGRTFFANTGQQYTRPFGLMSDSGSGGLVAALALGSILTLALLFHKRRYTALALLTGVAAITGIVTAQGRAVIICSVLAVIAYGLLTVTSRRGLIALVAIAGAVAVTAAVVGSVTGSSSSPALRYSSLTATNVVQLTEQNRGVSLSRIPHTLTHYPLGSGLGTGGPAAGVSGGPAAAEIADSENEFSFATLESGIPGLIAIVGFTVTLFVIGLRRIRHEPDPETRLLLAALIAPIAAIFALYFASAATPTTPVGPYLWAVGGVVSYWLVARPRSLARPRNAT